MRSLIAVVLALLAAGCGASSSPTSPTPATPPPAATVTVSGHVTATNGGQALSGLSARLGAAAVTTTDGGGAFVAPGLSPATAMPLALTGSSIVPRTVTVAVTTTRDVSVNAIALGGGFDLNFYRQLVRNTFDATTGVQPLRRLTRAPSLFIQTTDLVDAKTLDMVETVAREAIPAWTHGTFGVVAVERGAGTPRVGQSGWLSVTWSTETVHCGESDIAVDGGTVTFFPKRTTCACEGFGIARVLVRHELGHAAGFYHTDGATDVMAPSGWACNAQPAARELAHAAIAYTRPVGNVDPDTDPSSAVNLAPLRVR